MKKRTKRLLLLAAFCLVATLAGAQSLKGRIYYNGNMSVAHLMRDKGDESPEQRAEREEAMDEIFTMSVTVEFPTSDKMKARMKIMTDEERAKELGVSWANRRLWQTQLTVAAKRRDYWSKYTVEGTTVTIEDGSTMRLSDDGEQLYIDDDEMQATLKRIK